MKLRFFTNLDEAKDDVDRIGGGFGGIAEDSWFGGRVPCVGERVKLPIGEDRRDTYDLAVVDVAFNAATGCTEVELHIPPGRGWTIKTWSEWLTKRKRGEHG